MTVDPRRLGAAFVSVESLARRAQAAHEADRQANYTEPGFECVACGALLDHDIDFCQPCADANLPPKRGIS